MKFFVAAISAIVLASATAVTAYPAQHRVAHRRAVLQGSNNLLTRAANASVVTKADGSALTTVSTCTATYTVVGKDVCSSIATSNNVTLASLKSLNPSINSACSNLEIGAVLCLSNTSTGISANIKATKTNTTTTTTNSTSNSTSSVKGTLGSVSSDGWNFTKLHAGSSFFDDFDFYGDLVSSTSNDPTHGAVTFVGASTAWNQGLVSAGSTGAIMKIDGSSNNWNRNSIRIQSTDSYNVGTLLLMDATHIPTAKSGLWPAFWTVGPDWPNGGEIDILEYVNANQKSQTSFHTGSGCSMGTTGMNTTSTITGGTNCDSYTTGNAGCGVETEALAGEAFNTAGGGVYAMQWTSNGIYTWFWARSDIPADVTANSPKPTTWGLPMAYVASDNCNPSSMFKNHNIIFDLTTCGDWAGAAFDGGSSACLSYMANADLSEAYWNVTSLSVFQQTS